MKWLRPTPKFANTISVVISHCHHSRAVFHEIVHGVQTLPKCTHRDIPISWKPFFFHSGPFAVIVVSMPKRRRNSGWRIKRGQTYAEVDELWIEAAQAFFYRLVLPLWRSQCFLIRLLTFLWCVGFVIRAQCLSSNFIVFVHADTIYVLEPTHYVCRRLYQTIRVRRKFKIWNGISANQTIGHCQRMRVFRLHEMPRDERPVPTTGPWPIRWTSRIVRHPPKSNTFHLYLFRCVCAAAHKSNGNAKAVLLSWILVKLIFIYSREMGILQHAYVVLGAHVRRT